jgi:hypothetical protein
MLDRANDVLVPGAAAEVALEAVPDLFVGRRRVRAQQVVRREQHARRAEAALEPVLDPECVLQRMELASGRANPSIVVTSAPSACTAKHVHAFAALPSSNTTQAPHWLVSQPTFVPVSPAMSRRKWTSSSRGSTSA